VNLKIRLYGPQGAYWDVEAAAVYLTAPQFLFPTVGGGVAIAVAGRQAYVKRYPDFTDLYIEEAK